MCGLTSPTKTRTVSSSLPLLLLQDSWHALRALGLSSRRWYCSSTAPSSSMEKIHSLLSSPQLSKSSRCCCRCCCWRGKKRSWVTAAKWACTRHRGVETKRAFRAESGREDACREWQRTQRHTVRPCQQQKRQQQLKQKQKKLQAQRGPLTCVLEETDRTVSKPQSHSVAQCMYFQPRNKRGVEDLLQLLLLAPLLMPLAA